MKKDPDGENLQSKINFLEAFFDDLDDKIAFLDELYKIGHRDEANILCSCYIDWLGGALYFPDESNNFNFVRVLKEYGGDELFSSIHPRMLKEALFDLVNRRKGRKWPEIYNKISQELDCARGRLFHEQEVIDLISPLLERVELNELKKQLWRGTFAAIIYKQFRVPAVHGFGPSDWSFDNITFKEKPCPNIDFSLLRKTLVQIFPKAKKISIDSRKWFGHDFKI